MDILCFSVLCLPCLCTRLFICGHLLVCNFPIDILPGSVVELDSIDS